MRGRWWAGVAAAWAADRVWRWSGLGTLRRARSAQPGLGLLLEGGPDPAVTPAVLAALRTAGVTVTFAFEPPLARRHPGLAAQAAQEGHDVVPFVRVGWWPWTWWPALRVVPPGSAAPGLRLAGPVPAVVAALLSWRWGVALTAGQVQGRWADRQLVLPGVRPGALAHLSGTDPRLPEALPALLGDLKARGYEVRGLSGLRGLRPERPRDLPATALQFVDVLYDRVGRIRRVGAHASSLFRVGMASYPLADVALPGGERVRRGERLVEFHLDSARLTELAERPLAGRRIITHSVRDLARAVRDEPEWNAATAVFSISIFSDVLALYGFTVLDLPPGRRRALTWWSRVIRRAYGVSDPRKQHVPRLAVIAREDLIRRHARD
ncbi:hypothetical protein LAJ19_05825 [Deinococcus taeanensis]|uniref:YkoP family protein n=1 Tax=Deinococcus taeanensis TaxID=2737050 RepID=UPI001CDBA7D3|nr:hypothetical protein [Deinococcus taeanensis]UBV43733.1 hypothetical protein LAJ19_05825 [Deinococcus taeanensis]